MNKKKIALIGYRLSGGGGDRAMANLSNFFHKKDLEVHIIIFHDEFGYSYSGKVFNLGKLKNKTNGIFNKIKRFYHFNEYVKTLNFDFILDFRFRINFLQELLISKHIYSKTKVFYTVHSSEINHYMPDNTFLTKLIYRNNHKIVTITNDMKFLIEKKHQLSNVLNIYNPIDIEQIVLKSNDAINLDFDYIVGAGRFDTNEKQFDKLILAYSKSILPDKKIALVILGEGSKKEELIQLAKVNNIVNMVYFLGFKNNPYKYFRKAKYFILTSKYEGLPMVLLESLASGTPVISFDCPTGPKEIIRHETNGLLIENQDMEKLVTGMNKMIIDERLYLKCKSNAVKSIERFSLKTIGDEWIKLIGLTK